MSAVGIAPRFIRPAIAQAAAGLAPGMTGGPTGFPGAEAYQYNESMSEGRAIEGIKKLKAAGKAPDRLSMIIIDGVAGQLTQPFPAGAPTAKEVWERETGITLELKPVPIDGWLQPVMHDRVSNAGKYDIYSMRWNSLGDLVVANVLHDCTEFYAKYKPDFADPARGYIGGQRTVNYLNSYDGKYYAVSLDGDFQGWYYRRDLFEDAAEQKAFRARFGYDLRYPQTYRELDQMAQFFHRPDKGLLGYTDWRNRGWGWVNWYGRYVSLSSPNQYLFDSNGNPLLDTDAGIAATNEYLASMKWRNKDAAKWTYVEQYGNFAKCGAAMTSAVPNLPKFLDVKGNPLYGKCASAVIPGREVDGRIVRRSVLNYNVSQGVSAQSRYPEAAWCFLQWLGSSRTFTWVCGNPSGYMDPLMHAQFEDPLVAQTYRQYNLDTASKNIERAIPSINFEGELILHSELDRNLMAVITGAMSPEEAMSKTATVWRGYIASKPADYIDRINDYQKLWPTLTDPVT
jgi:multiple sugar transport system substrate-binding protein